MDDYKYKIYIPSGNPTALVIGIENNLETRQRINDELMRKYDFIEQVGFINQDKNNPELLMAGGEFCGNATRCAVKYYLNNQEGTIKIKVSGVLKALSSGIDSFGNVWLDMPIIKGYYNKSIKIIDNIAIIKLYGITHVVIENNVSNIVDKEKIKKRAYNLLKKYNLLNEKAAGVMYVNKDNDNISLIPIVYVRDINTLFLETACGSGTTAVAIYESFKCKKNVNINVLQPSKEIINVQTKTDKTGIYNVRISSKVIEYQERS